MEYIIREHERVPDPYRSHYRRLFQEGATGQELMTAILSVYGASHYANRKLGLDDAVFFANVGNRFLRTKGLGGFTREDGTRVHRHLPGMLCETVGRTLNEKLGVFCLQFWRMVERDRIAQQTPMEGLAAALADHPL
ncbi:hypothetical protein [Lysobacter sp. M2-1]|uniref:hypothetical protein n=1 Tax=Lysobacter sp. M2-1 TaxID=2916839 RepID=UPI001F55CE9E|nr:hypothetical protein [Lysobacter sp. M2-1]